MFLITKNIAIANMFFFTKLNPEGLSFHTNMVTHLHAFLFMLFILFLNLKTKFLAQYQPYPYLDKRTQKTWIIMLRRQRENKYKLCTKWNIFLTVTAFKYKPYVYFKLPLNTNHIIYSTFKYKPHISQYYLVQGNKTHNFCLNTGFADHLNS